MSEVTIGIIEKWKLPIVLPTSREKRSILPFPASLYCVFQTCKTGVQPASWGPWRRRYLTMNSAAYVAAINDLHLIWVLKFLANPNKDLERDCIFGKPMKLRFQWCIIHTEILSVFYAWVVYISVQQICRWNTETSGSKTPWKPLGHIDPHLMHPSLHRPHSPRQTTARLVHALLHNYATNSPLVTVGRPKFPPKPAASLWRSPPHLIYPSLDRPHSPSQTASWSNQSFFHRSPTGQTDRQTERWSRRQVSKNTARYADREQRANKVYTVCVYLHWLFQQQNHYISSDRRPASLPTRHKNRLNQGTVH